MEVLSWAKKLLHLIVYQKDRLADAKGKKLKNILTMYGIPWWLPFLSTLHKFACLLISGYGMFWLALSHESTSKKIQDFLLDLTTEYSKMPVRF